MNPFSVSPQSEKAGRKRPGDKLLCSASTAWRSLLIQTYEQPAFVDLYETGASPDVLIVLVARGEYHIESFASGRWQKAVYRPGAVGITAPRTVNRLRWHSPSLSSSRVIRAYVPSAFFEEAAEEFRKAGTKAKAICQDALCFRDATVASVLHSLTAAAQAGMPDFYAEAGARYLATHLCSRAHGLPDAEVTRRTASELTDRRLRRVLDFMAWNFAEPLTIAQLAREAGISHFHFCHLFRTKMGRSPHQHLVRLRTEHAEKLLRSTDRSVAEIVVACGYSHAGHFAASFSRLTGRTPSEYRRWRQRASG